MRMALDLVVYMAMVVVFSTVMLLHNDGALRWGGALFAVCVFVTLSILSGATSSASLAVGRGYRADIDQNTNSRVCL